MVSLVKHDLEFILKQIKIAEAHSGGTPLSEIRVDANGDVTTDVAAPLALSDPLAPYGLRTVDGSYNNLVEGREQWGAADESFPRLTDPYWRNEGDDAMTFGAGANTFPLTNNDYSAAGAPPPASMGLGGGTVVDADPRLISNLIVDQTLANPAAVYAALVHAGVTGAAITAAMQAIAAANAPYESAAAAAANAEAAMEAAQNAVDAARAAYEASGDPADAAALSAAIGVSIDAIQASAEAADAAQEARADLDAVLAQHGVEMDGKSVVIPNVAPDEGLSAPYNSWFTLFGQFFDHGLDLVAKSGNGTVYIPLQPDDPLYNPASPHTNFMALTRTSQGAPNLTTPWVDQNQTYGSTASKQLFMREYAMVDGKPVATGMLLEGADGGLATWKDVKDQAREKLGVLLTDANIGNIPLFVMDDYGEFVRGPNGFPQIVRSLGADGLFGGGDDVFEEGNPAAPISALNAVLTGHAFLDDIAHAAVPVLAGGVLQADGDEAVGYANADGSAGPVNSRGSQTAYDNELLDAHFITGDGRGNENIGLTAVHHVFHSEHNHTVDQVKVRAVEAAMAGDLAFLNEWLAVDIAGSVALPAADASPAEILSFAQTLAWDGERLFQAARFTTEMQYQHLVFEEFARKVQPDVDAFVFNPSMDINPAIFAEFAHVVYRFGHSMLNETVDRTYEDGTAGDLDLFSAFLNPVAFSGVQRDESGAIVLGQDGQPIVLDAAAAAGAIARGMTAQRGNEIDEFVTDVLRNQLLGIPLDLAALNIARGRETGIPPLNEARRQFQEIASGDTQLSAYESWTDFALNLKNPASIVNFIAAYGTHATITGAGTAAAKRAAATALVFGAPGLDEGDRQAFLNGTGSYANRLGGLEDVDLWVGGLAEKKMAFGGMLGSTFSFIFELQLENLQNADRFYYLSRVQGLNFLNELENNSLAKMVLNNTDLGESGFAVPGDIFSVPDHVLYVDKAMQLRFGYADPQHEDPFLEAVSKMVERVDANGDGVAEYLRVNTNDHVLIQGTDGADVIVAGGGDDSVWGRGGDDRIEAGYGVDKIHGGTGDDIITNSGTDIGEVDMLHGEEGNDVIHGGSGLALIFGNQGQDVIITGPDGKEAFGGTGNDFILGGDGGDFLLGNEGDDWIEGGNGFDTTAGDNSELFFNSTIIGHDVMFAGQNEHDFDAESGDDIMVQGESVMRNEGMLGFDWAIHKGNTEAADSDLSRPIFTTDVQDILRDRFDAVEALSGWDNDDVLKGDDRAAPGAGGEAPPNPDLAGAENTMVGHQLTQAGVDRIEGLRELLGDLIAAAPTIVDPETIVAFEAGNILLGGGGSDQITGRGGDDLIDGDRWLNVRIRFVEEGVAYTADTLGGPVWREADYEDGKPVAAAVAQFGGKSLVSLTLDRTVNPGQLSIHREIANAAPDDTGIDTAVYGDAWANYTLTRNGDGSVTLDHTGFGNDVTVTVSDGRDRLHNIERLQFSDRTIYLTDVAATGTVLISDTTPTETRTITATINDLVDLNGATNPALSFQWQRSADGGSTWTTIAGATGASYTPNQASVGQILRARVSFTDDMGFAEELFSAPTGVVGDVINGTGQSNTLTGTAGDDIINGNGGNDTLNGLAGDDELSGGTGNDTIDGGDGADLIEGGAGNDTINGGAGDDTIVWSAQFGLFSVSTDGRDIINGGTEGAGGDTFVANGAALLPDTFSIYTRAAAQAAFGYAGTAEIVIRHSAQPLFGGANSPQIIAELTDIEEIRINSAVVSSGTPANGSSGGDTIQVFGDFTQTSLNLNTITIGGSGGDDVVDITGLTSAHRIVFKSNGGNDTIVGTLRPQDVIDLPPGASLATYTSSQNGNGTTTFSNGSHSITFASNGMPTFAETPDDESGEAPTGQGAFAVTQRDLDGLKKLINGERPFADDDDADGALGVRDIAGTGNNGDNPDYGTSDTPFVRLTDAHYGALDPAIGNRGLNPIFAGLDPREISNILGAQEADLGPAANGSNIFFMAFGQYFDHGLDFIPKNSAFGTVQIGAPGNGAPGSGNPADLTRGEVLAIDENGVPQHLNKVTAFVDQNQAYGSHMLVAQFLREGDGAGGFTAHLMKGAPDPSNPAFNLLPTLREAIEHHWANNTVFTLPSGGTIGFRDYYTAYPVSDTVTGDLLDAAGGFDPQVLSKLASNFMGSGHALLLDTNPFISLLDHYVAGDGRANENFALTSMHTIWARNHNFHAEQLEEAGFVGTAEELFQAAKVINEAEYQRVVFTEFADKLLGGMRGVGDHGHGGYNPDADAGISHEFAAAAYRFGHSLIGQTMTVLGPDGQPKQVSLFDAFLNPTNDADAFPVDPSAYYTPQPGYEQYGVGAILGGIVNQAAEESDFNIVDAVRNDLVRINADLFAFNVARGRDVGLGTLNQIRTDLAASQSSYVSEAVSHAGDLSAYASWEDFQVRNGLSNAVIAQFRAAYPDLVLASAEEIAAFSAANPDIVLQDGPNGAKIVKGIDRVDVWVGGLAEKHINGGMVGQTFWVVLHEQFDRLQEADRFYYKDRLEAFDFYEEFIDGQEFADIVARNTGLTGWPEDIFGVSDEDGDDDGDTGTIGGDDDDGDTVGGGEDDDADGDDAGSGGDDGEDDEDEDDTPVCGGSTLEPAPGEAAGTLRSGTSGNDVLAGTIGADNIVGFAGDDVLLGDDGDDALSGGTGDDFIDAGAGRDVVFAGAGDDQVFGGAGADMLYGDAGADRIFGGAGDDFITAGAGDDTVVAGAGNDLIVAEIGDGNDTYFGDEAGGGAGIDTLDMSLITAAVTVDLGTGLTGKGSAVSAQTGTDTLWSIENVVTGSGADTITASVAVNVMDGGAGADTFRFTSTAAADGDTIVGFEPGDRLDFSAIDANAGAAGDQSFTLVTSASFTAAGQLMVTYESRAEGAVTVIEGNVNGDSQADFRLEVQGTHALNSQNVVL